jgi:serine/threonine protein kinase/tetratricopeptide (TPR) repeat protein
MAGQTISHYELAEVLGESGQGVVYKAWDLESKIWVSLRVLHTVPPEEEWLRLQHMAGTLSALKHPSIATIRDIARTSLNAFTVTEYLPGGTLKAQIQALQAVGDKFPLEDILGYALQIAEGLLSIHRRGICHRNLTSESVMFDAAGQLKITGFDLEPAATNAIGEQADVVSFGILLYELSTAELPFQGLQGAMPPGPMPAYPISSLERLRKDLPVAFRQIVSRALERERGDCYKDMGSLVGDLKSLRNPAVAPTAAQRTRTRIFHDGFESYSTTIASGRVLAGRFKIVRFIASGGMGQVYEAEDMELGEHVALKTVRPDIAREERAMERFRREIHLARKVTHPNVCRIFDVFHHVETSQDDGGFQQKITFLSMELLKGETLARRLERRGRMQLDEAMPIILQMASALAAAHAAGVIHRDFKSSNVVLVPSASEGGDSRVVVTDFGLARSTAGGESLATLSRAAEPIGTPAYMAPEQVAGEEITGAADIYAFGIVMYEMVTGTLPFLGESGFAVALKRLTESPLSPREHAPDVDVQWEDCILRCLELKPSDRFSTFGELVAELSGAEPNAERETLKADRGASSQRPTRSNELQRYLSRRIAVAAVAVLSLAVLMGFLALRYRGDSPATTPSRKSVAVLGFRNLAGQESAAWLSTALAEMLTTELAAGEKLRAIPGETVARMRVDLSLPESSSFAPDTLARIRSYLGADMLILGSYLVLDGTPNKVRLDLRLQDSTNGDVLATISDEGYPTELLDLVSRSGAQLRERLGVGTLGENEASSLQAALPATPEAAQFYSEGLQKLRLFDAGGARPLLEKAVAADPRYALAHSALATAWSMLGYGSRAQDDARRALDLSKGLAREEQLLVEGRYRETAMEWNQAAEVYRTLFGFFPDNLDYGLRLAAAQTSAGKASDALATVSKLRGFPAPDGDNPRIDLAEARAAGVLSDFRRQQAMAAQAVIKGQATGAKLVVAGARLIEGSALAEIGDLQLATSALENARQLYNAAGDRWDAANAATNLAYVFMKSGDLARAKTIYQDSLSLYRELGDRKGAAAGLVSLANIFRSEGNLVQARIMHQEALAIYRETGDRIGEAKSQNNMANILSLVGELTEARRMYEAALPVFREVGDRNGAATVLSNLADLHVEQGDLLSAAALHEESQVLFRALGNKSSLAYELSRTGDLLLIKGDMRGARARHEEALALRTELGEKGSIGDSQLALAQISLQEGSLAAAERAAKLAIEQFRSANRADDESSGLAVLARSLLAQGRTAESEQAIRRAQELSQRSSDRRIRLSVAISAASIRAALGDAAQPLSDLIIIVREARNAGLVSLELEARLILGQIEASAGRLRDARDRLEALEAEALSRGYKSIADRAAAARRRMPSISVHLKIKPEYELQFS